MKIYTESERIIITEPLETDKLAYLELCETTEDGLDMNRKAGEIIIEKEGYNDEQDKENKINDWLINFLWSENSFITIIRTKKDNEFIGKIALADFQSELPELSIDILPRYQNQGYGPEAIIAFKRVCKEKFGTRNIRVRIRKGNAHSQHVFEKLGAIYECDHSYFSDSALATLREQFAGMDISSFEEKNILWYRLEL